jgi:2-haloacid dehalogenase
MMAVLRGAVFDAYGTLFDVHSIAKRAEQRFPGAGTSISLIWREKQIEYSRVVTMSDPSPSGSRYYQSFWELTRAALVYSLRKLSLPYTSSDLDTLMSGYAQLDAFPECLAVLQTLKARGLVTAILSNGSPEMLNAAAESSGLSTWLDRLMSVEPVRQFKTSPACYAIAPQTLSLPAESLLFVSSNAWDVVGAQWFGFRTCWVNRQGLPFETIGEPPHHMCSSLEGVLALVPAISNG